MYTIVCIKFPSSKKEYSYLFDPNKCGFTPKPGDTFDFCSGTTKLHPVATRVEVTCAKLATLVPPIVTSELVIDKETRMCGSLPIEHLPVPTIEAPKHTVNIFDKILKACRRIAAKYLSCFLNDRKGGK